MIMSADFQLSDAEKKGFPCAFQGLASHAFQGHSGFKSFRRRSVFK
jgi:hypothetical protein